MSRLRLFLLAALVVGAMAIAPAIGSKAPPGTTDPLLVVPAGETVRLGDAVPDALIVKTWESFTPLMRESLRQRKGIASLEDLRDLRITGPHVFGGTTNPPPSDELQEVAPVGLHELPLGAVSHVVRATASGVVESANHEMLASQNPCTAKAAKANKVHYSQTDWCYDGEVISSTPKPYILWAYGTRVSWLEFLSYHTQEAISANIGRASGGYGYDHLKDESWSRVEHKIYIDGDMEADVCVSFNSYIIKRGLGNGNSSSPQAGRGPEGLC